MTLYVCILQLLFNLKIESRGILELLVPAIGPRNGQIGNKVQNSRYARFFTSWLRASKVKNQKK